MTELHDVLHGLAIKKHADAATLGELLGNPPETLQSVLGGAVASGRAAEAQGKFMLTPAGHMILENQYPQRYAVLREDERFIAAYDQFELINAELKQTITDWQVMDIGGQSVRNNHADPAYDEKIIGRIAAIHERMERILTTFTGSVGRFARYASKLESALERAEDGEREWVSDATIESYHTVWFEMHEDLLRILARQRDE